jgi:two-component system, sensor histidine kinase LadS
MTCFLRLVFAVLLLLPYSLLGAQPNEAISALDGSPTNFFYQNLSYYEDFTRHRSVEEVHLFHERGLFETYPSEEGISLGFSKAACWVRVEIPQMQHEQELVLESQYPLIDSVFLYEYQENTDGSSYWLVRKRGDRYPFPQRDLPYKNVSFRLASTKHRQLYYLRFSTEGSLQVGVQVHTRDAFLEKVGMEQLIFGSFFGCLVILAFYSLSVGVLFKEVSYLHYAFVILTSLFFIAVLDGYAFQYLWQDSPDWSNEALPFFMGMLVVAKSNFMQKFLRTAQNHILIHNFFHVLAIMGMLVATFVFLGYYSFFVQASIIVGLLTAVNTFVACVLSRAKGNMGARYAVSGSYLYLVSMLFIVLKSMGLIERTFLTRYSIELGTLCFALLFALALGDTFIYQKALHNKSTPS